MEGMTRRGRRQLYQQQNQRAVVRSDGQDLISNLPDECTQTIFAFLSSARDRCACAAVSKKWLVLLAHMRGCEFNSFRQASRMLGLSHASTAGAEETPDEASRCLEATEANDARLAAMAVGTYARRLLGNLSVRGGPPVPAQQRITDFGLHIVSHSFPNLRSLALWDCVKVGSSGLAAIAECCRALEKLDISNTPGIDDDGLVPIAKNCPNLSALSIESCPLVGNRALEALAKCSSHLESISIAKCPQVGDVGIISLVSHLSSLTKVRLSHLKLGNATLEAIGRHQGSLKVLSLENLGGLTMAGFTWIRLATKLEVLSLNNCTGLTDVEISHRVGGASLLPAFRMLRQVNIRRCGYLKDEGLVGLTSSTNHLQTLTVERCNRITGNGIMSAVRNCGRTLKVLSLVRCNGVGLLEEEEEEEEEERDYGGSYPSLDSLTLKNCDKVDDWFLTRIAPMCPQVSHIELVGLASVTDRGLFSLLKWVSPLCTAAARVNLGGCVGVTDWTVVNVARTFGERLEILSLEGCAEVGDRSLEVVGEVCSGLKELDVSGTKVGDGGVVSVAMAAHQKLEVLSLGGCAGLTDAGLACVEMMCGGLVGLNLQRCVGVSLGAVESLRSTLWWCDLLC